MKSKLSLAPIKIAFLIASLSLYSSGTTIAQAGDRHIPVAAPVGSGNSGYRAELPQGSLTVFSATDEFDDGGVLYYAHSSYTVYKTNGKFVKSVRNQLSRSDEIPEIVTLPVGSYIVEARSAKTGYVERHVVIRAGQRTTLDLESKERNSLVNDRTRARSDVAKLQTKHPALAQSNRGKFFGIK